ncbi:MAG: hypothetical protein QM784_37895 [Polyangiaceae bacterium]
MNWRLAGLLLAAASCGRSNNADLGSSQRDPIGSGGATSDSQKDASFIYANGAPVFDTTPPDTPFKLVRGETQWNELWAQGDRIHWGRAFSSFRSCNVDNCASTLQTVEDPSGSRAADAIENPTEAWPDRYQIEAGENGTPDSPLAYEGKKLTFDEEFAYAAAEDYLVRCRTNDCDATRLVIPLRSPVGAPLTFRDTPQGASSSTNSTSTRATNTTSYGSPKQAHF